MKNFEHYKRGYYMPPVQSTDWVNKEYIDKAPAWCSVDLRDGNQALIHRTKSIFYDKKRLLISVIQCIHCNTKSQRIRLNNSSKKRFSFS